MSFDQFSFMELSNPQLYLMGNNEMSNEATTVSELAGLLVVEPEGDAEAGASTLPEDTGTNEPTELEGAGAENDNPEEGSDGAENSGEGEADEESEPGSEEAEDEAIYDVTVNGETVKVPLKELVAGYSRQSDYTRKAQELSDQRRAVEEALNAAGAHRASYKQALDALLERIGPVDQEPTAEQWNQLRSEDPDRYAIEWADFQRRQEARGAVETEKNRVDEEAAAEARSKLQEFVDGQRKLLHDKMHPFWKGKDGKLDMEKVKTGLAKINSFVKEAYGFTDDELKTAYDHRMIVMAHEAMLWRNAEKARKAAKEKLAGAPDMPAPGTRAQPRSSKRVARDEAQKKFDRSGRVDDAVSLMFK